MINVFFLLMLLSETIASTSQVLLKKSAIKEYPNIIKEYLNVLVIGGYFLLVLAMVISIYCYSGLGYMGVVVMEPIAYVIVMFMSRVVFKEKFVRSKIIGMVLIVSGIVVFYALG
ncbi:multidrug ABC transporter [Butyrivibrio sp. CB08]|uniref:multidrug ABC transporter n=1 Tax=Butyrivibrio sp. CB08 TaxID=2364879 RepID=UPI000EAA5CF4|nr:multidrug ABC transporter [Butyrivibrio sp. CB08]RKM57840.1 multidrug ABC transporter [Butyrivibrio sp. CB08]